MIAPPLKYAEMRMESVRQTTLKIRSAEGIRELSNFVANEIRFQTDLKSSVIPLESNQVKRHGCTIVTQASAICSHRIWDKRKLEDTLAVIIANRVSNEPLPGEKKRYQRPSYAFLVGALSALDLDNLDDDFGLIIQAAREEAAILAGAAAVTSHYDTLQDLTEGIKEAKDPERLPSAFARHVANCMIAYRDLSQGGCEKPNKKEVRDKASKLLADEGYEPFADTAHWRPVYAAAGLKNLPQQRGGARAKPRHGGSGKLG